MLGMSAEAFGAKLLAEAQEEPLASLLSDLRALQCPHPGSVTGLLVLDSIIEAYRYPAAITFPFHAGATSPDFNLPIEDDFDFYDDDYDNVPPVRGSRLNTTKPKPLIINVSHGPHSSSAATMNLLYYLLALSILPQQHGGKQGTALYIDCSDHFSATQLYQTTLSCLRRSKISAEALAAPPTAIAKDCLTHVHVQRCTSSRSLLCTLKELPAYLLDSNAHQSSQRPVRLLIVHGLNSFYWQDRLDTEIARLENVNASSLTGSTAPLSTQIIHELKSVQEMLECAVIYTTTPTIHSATSSRTSGPEGNGTSPMPAPNEPAAYDISIYTRTALLNLHPTRVGVAQFAPAMTIEECLCDKGKRGDAVRKTKYWVAATAGGLSEKKDGVRTGRPGTGFGMWVAKEGSIWFE